MGLWPKLTTGKRSAPKPCAACGDPDGDTMHLCPGGKLCEGGRQPVYGPPETRAPHTHGYQWCPACGEYDDESGQYANWDDGDA